MKEHERHHKEPGSKKGKQNGNSRSFDGEHKEVAKVDNEQHIHPDENTTGRMGFHIDFWLAEGQVQGKITHRFTKKQVEFSGLDQETIIQFMRQYLSRLEKSVIKEPVDDVSQQIPELAEEQQEEPKKTPPSGMKSRSFGVIPAGTTHPTRVLEQGRPFQIQWSFEPPSLLSMLGQQQNYMVIICRKNLAGGGRELVGKIEGQRDFSEPLVASFECESLPSGTYRLEGEASFWSLKSGKPEWKSSCSQGCIITVS